MSIKFIKSYNKNTPSWETCLENFDKSVLENDLIKYNGMGYFVSHRAHTINQVRLVLEDLKLTSAHLYMNITAHGGSNGNHVDQDDVYFWQAQGRTRWQFDGGYEYLLEPGDLIFVPADVYHNVIPLGPRIGISMSL
jgi:ribosomal protein L16 Arg81 hydroxylase